MTEEITELETKIEGYELNIEDNLAIFIPQLRYGYKTRLVLKRSNPNFDKICDLLEDYDRRFTIKIKFVAEERTNYWVDNVVTTYYKVIDLEPLTFEGVLTGIKNNNWCRKLYFGNDEFHFEDEGKTKFRLGKSYKFEHDDGCITKILTF